MCEPTTAAIVIGVGALQGYAASQQQSAANKAADYNASILVHNAQVAETKAEKAEEQGVIAESRFRKELGQMIGSQRAGFASSGVVVDEGTAMDVVAETRAVGEEDALTIRYNAALQAFDYRSQAQDFLMRAELERRKKRSTTEAGVMGFLSGVTSLGSTYALSR